jgi:hypothetical protein
MGGCGGVGVGSGSGSGSGAGGGTIGGYGSGWDMRARLPASRSGETPAGAAAGRFYSFSVDVDMLRPARKQDVNRR